MQVDISEGQGPERKFRKYEIGVDALFTCVSVRRGVNLKGVRRTNMKRIKKKAHKWGHDRAHHHQGFTGETEVDICRVKQREENR